MDPALPSPDAARTELPPPWREVVRRLLVHARCLGAPAEEAEDLAHEAIEVVVADPDWFDPSRGSLVTALKTVLRHRWSNRRRAAGVAERAGGHLRLVEPAPAPDAPLAAARAAEHRQRFLALLEPDERAVFGAWMRQRAREVDGAQAARALGLSLPAYESANKRLRRRAKAILDELGLVAADLYDPPGGPR
ncbi:MAG: hypothetical protein R3F59_01385 [Myxococcota bacterium]